MRLGNLLDVETETHRDGEICWMSRPRLIETGKFAGCRDRDQSRLGQSCRYRDSIETLAQVCMGVYQGVTNFDGNFIVFISTAQKTIRFCSRISEISLFSYATTLSYLYLQQTINPNIQREILFLSNDSNVHRSIWLIEPGFLTPILPYFTACCVMS